MDLRQRGSEMERIYLLLGKIWTNEESGDSGNWMEWPDLLRR